MKRNIFIGSSTEALEQARHVCTILQSMEDVDAMLWTEVFNPGEVPLEALEDMLRKCCAAVFIVTADDKTIIRDRQVNAPRANVMLEFGLVAGRLGHQSVAVCEYGCPELPSDLAGLTVIHMDPTPDVVDAGAFHRRAEDSLKLWSSRLLATAPGVPRTEIVHGYAGRWDFDIDLHTWRDLKIAKPGFAHVKGYLDLYLPSTGQVGRGLAHGRLQFRVMNGGSACFMGEYRTAHDVRNAVCGRDGTLELLTEAFALQKMQSSGEAPIELQDVAALPEPWSAHWTLNPTGPFTLAGKVESQGGIMTEGVVTATKWAG